MDRQLENLINDYIKKYKTIRMTEIPERESSFLKVKSFKCELNSGAQIIREQCLRNNLEGDVVTILPITASNNIVMVAQPRVFTPLTVGFELPAGYVDVFEYPEDAALRELLEETGYLPMGLEKLISYQGDPGCSSAVNHCFVATSCQLTNKQNLDESEYVDFFECSLDDAMEMQASGLVVGSSSIVTLQKVYGKRQNYGI